MKNNNQMKSMPQMQTGMASPGPMNQKFKSNYEYLISKNQQEPGQQRHNEMHSSQNGSSSASLLSSLNVQQLDVSQMDVGSNLHSMSSSLSLKPNTWLPYSFQLNNESNNTQKMLSNSGNHQLTASYNEFYDKIIKKSPNTNFNYER